MVRHGARPDDGWPKDERETGMLNQLLYAGPPLRVLHEEYAKNARIDDEDVALSGTHEGRHLMRGFITPPRAPRGPSLAGDLPEPVPAPVGGTDGPLIFRFWRRRNTLSVALVLTLGNGQSGVRSSVAQAAVG